MCRYIYDLDLYQIAHTWHQNDLIINVSNSCVATLLWFYALQYDYLNKSCIFIQDFYYFTIQK
jgi:hypothetical protein